MDAHALLTSQGWRGAGHSLHATSDAIGLAKPLLLNRRDGNKGLGQKPHYTSDQWWMNAFDEQLSGLQETKAQDGRIGVVQTVTSGRINGIEKGMGGRWRLGGNFVKGGFLEGTIEALKRQAISEEISSEDKSTGVSTPVEGESKEERRRRKAEKAARRAEREARRKRKEEEKNAKREKRRSLAAGADEDSSSSGKPEKQREETKEERRARREAKRLRREAREAKKA